MAAMRAVLLALAICSADAQPPTPSTTRTGSYTRSASFSPSVVRTPSRSLTTTRSRTSRYSSTASLSKSSSSTLSTTQSQAPSALTASPLPVVVSPSTTPSATPSAQPLQAIVFQLSLAAALSSLPPSATQALLCDISAGLTGALNVSASTWNVMQLASATQRNGTVLAKAPRAALAPGALAPCALLCPVPGGGGGLQLCVPGTLPVWPPAAPANPPAPAPTDLLSLGFAVQVYNATVAGAAAAVSARLAALVALGAPGFPAFASLLTSYPAPGLLVNTTLSSPGLSVSAASAAALPTQPPAPPAPAPAAAAAAAPDSAGLIVGLLILFLALACLCGFLVYNYAQMMKQRRAIGKPAQGVIVNYEEKLARQYIARGGHAPATLVEHLQRTYPLPTWMRLGGGTPMPLATSEAAGVGAGGGASSSGGAGGSSGSSSSSAGGSSSSGAAQPRSLGGSGAGGFSLFAAAPTSPLRAEAPPAVAPQAPLQHTSSGPASQPLSSTLSPSGFVITSNPAAVV